MQKRHTDRRTYFLELSHTSEKYYIPYLKRFVEVSPSCRVLEFGCGEGGNLLPFVDLGCEVHGVDQSEVQIERAKIYFEDRSVHLLAADFLQLTTPKDEKERFDIILLHDVIEHIERPFKADFVQKLLLWLKESGVLFVGFPAWQMPFGGHQQICKSKMASALPFVHLLPTPIYKSYLRICGESDECIHELLSIKRSKISIEHFEKLVKENGYTTLDRIFWFINPHYEVKFGLTPRKLFPVLGKTPIVRNYFTTSSFYLLKKR